MSYLLADLHEPFYFILKNILLTMKGYALRGMNQNDEYPLRVEETADRALCNLI